MKKWIIAAMLITVSVRAAAYKVPYEAWMGTYIGDAKIGYLNFRVDRADGDDQTRYRITSTMNNKMTVLGTDVTQVVSTTVVTDDKFNPLSELFEMSSGGRTTSVSAEFRKNTIECVLSTGAERSHKSIPIPDGARLVGDAMFGLTDPDVKVGTVYELHYFNPLTLAVDNLTVRVERRETVEIAGTKYDALVVRNSSPLGDVTIWQDAEGDVLKVLAMAGITMLRETREQAMSGIHGSASDFAVLTSVKSDKSIREPRRVRSLDIVLQGMTDTNMVISDARQNAQPVKEQPGAVYYKIRAKNFTKRKSVSIPVENRPEMAEFLEVTPYLDYNLGGVAAKAAEIVGDEKNAYEACSRLRSWVFQNMRTRADVGISRPASDVLKSREGVCRDYAILLAAFARSLGIPARIAAGLTFTNGAFYYHAWVECWVGEWVPFDATLATDFVDATHIKLAQGQTSSMFGLARVIGGLKAQVKASS